jgi:hypothetical protein
MEFQVPCGLQKGAVYGFTDDCKVKEGPAQGRLSVRSQGNDRLEGIGMILQSLVKMIALYMCI